jgi:aminoglycoside phosphotransferase (APT) family kinase protein
VRRIGHGGEATAYELTGGRVLRVFHDHPHEIEALAAFYRKIEGHGASFRTPEVLEYGEDSGVHYSVDRLIPGRALHELLPSLRGVERERALDAYADAVWEIAALPYSGTVFGEIMREDAIQAETWAAYLLRRMERCLDVSRGYLREDVAGLDEAVGWLERSISAMPAVTPGLVHGDYFPGNVLVSDDLAVSGVIDFGPLTVIGDRMMDAASALIFLEVSRPGYTQADSARVRRRLARACDAPLDELADIYRGWYAIRFSPYRDDDANLYAWCAGSLRMLRERVGG